MSCGTMLPAMAFILWPSVLRGRWWPAGDGGWLAMAFILWPSVLRGRWWPKGAGGWLAMVAGRRCSFADIEAMIKIGYIFKKKL